VHYYEFNIPAWVLHTSHLTLEEECVYRRLLDLYYDTEKPIPEETKTVIRRLRLVNYESIVVQILGEVFHLEADGWHNNRADIVISEYQAKADKARENGKKGGRPKQNKAPETKPVILDNPEETGSKANKELLTINNELKTNLKDIAPQAAPTATPEKSKLDYSCWPAMPTDQTLIDWLAMRKRLKANVSQTVINRFASELRKAETFGYTVDQCLAECVTRNWRGFEAQWLLNSQQPAGKQQFKTAAEKEADRNAYTFNIERARNF